ncbi:Partitioning defective 6 -like protein gamma [Takifugu flavidus]|uniref:Partitioning defective 6-like protein gamma n=1 Tax=Takifugu flavidus TaxID=433684 RepID=A0A5C6NGS7_9TELE|nr:Partitioning defective 6 -like protein gamma [Takifugu flavidus]
MNRSFHKSQPLRSADCNAVEVKSKGGFVCFMEIARVGGTEEEEDFTGAFVIATVTAAGEGVTGGSGGVNTERASLQVSRLSHKARIPRSTYGAEFRRFSVDRAKPGKFEEFYKLILHIHRIANMEVMIGYADIHGDLLPINNDDNFCKAVSTAHPLLRIFIQRQVGCLIQRKGSRADDNMHTRARGSGNPIEIRSASKAKVTEGRSLACGYREDAVLRSPCVTTEGIRHYGENRSSSEQKTSWSPKGGAGANHSSLQRSFLKHQSAVAGYSRGYTGRLQRKSGPTLQEIQSDLGPT